MNIRKLQFQSAPPVKGAIELARFVAAELYVSIRAPREGGDKANGKFL